MPTFGSDLLIFATNNLHKLEEARQMIGDRFLIKGLADIGCDEDIPETGVTFKENASLKSSYLASKFGLDGFADDSGLEVEALNNEPGVYSARYSGSRDMETNIDLVLNRLGDSKNRRACFRTVISLQLSGREYFFDGVVWGTIGYERRGAAGFGYDPIFTPEGHDQTFAEMTFVQKNSLSHRGMAIQQLADFLQSSGL